jgi:hypothetical protein
VWARIIFAMLRSHEPSDRAIFEKAQTLHAVQAAERFFLLRGNTACFFAFN